MHNDSFHTQPIPKLYMQMALPVVFSMLITIIYNLTDMYFVAATGNTSLVAGVSLGAPVFTFLMALGNIFGQGGGSLLSRLLGCRDMESFRRVSSWCFYMSLLIGIVIAAVLLLLHRLMLSLLGASPDTWSYARDYYLWLVAGAPFVVNSFVHSNFLRTEGLARESMIGTIGGSVVNMVLDPIFISILGWGASGAAISTVCGYAFTVFHNLYAVRRKSPSLSVSPKEFHISAAYKAQILAIGFAAAVTNIMQSVGAIFLNQGLLPYGDDKIAAMGIAIKVSMIVLMILTGLTFGGQPLYGFFYGAGDRKRLTKSIRFAVGSVTLTAIVLSLLVFLFAPQLLSVFLSDPSIAGNGVLMLRLQVITMIFVGLIMLLTVLFQSFGKALPALILSLARQGVVFIIAIFLLSRVSGYHGVLAAQAVSDGITMFHAAVLAYLYLFPLFKKES